LEADWFADESHQAFEISGESAGALLLHGFMGTPREMRPLARKLSETGVGVVAPLLPGFGPRIAEIDRVGMRDWVAEAAEAWEKLRAQGRANILLGFSMGAAIAMHLARDCPPGKLILLAPLWRLMGGDWRLKLLPVIKHVVRKVRPFANADFSDPEVRQFFEGAVPDLDLDQPDVQKRIRDEVAIATSTIDELRRLSASAGSIASRIQCETLVVQGTEDFTVRLEDTRELVSRMPSHVQFEELNGDHLLVSNDRRTWSAVSRLVLEFTDPGGR
jgi:carboxylesterase